MSQNKKDHPKQNPFCTPSYIFLKNLKEKVCNQALKHTWQRLKRKVRRRRKKQKRT